MVRAGEERQEGYGGDSEVIVRQHYNAKDICRNAVHMWPEDED